MLGSVSWDRPLLDELRTKSDDSVGRPDETILLLDLLLVKSPSLLHLSLYFCVKSMIIEAAHFNIGAVIIYSRTTH